MSKQADLLFTGASVIDGSGAPAFTADVAVAGGLIKAVGDLSDWTAERTVDAAGLTLSPGFVDAHGHSDYYLFILPSAESKLKQGITTEVGGNCGYSAAPVRGIVAEDRKKSHQELYGFEIDWENMDQYLEKLSAARPAINFVPLVGFNTVRGSAGHFVKGPPESVALAAMKRMVRESMEAGAFGMSLGLIYPPGAFADADEIIDVGKEVAPFNGIISSHMRSEGNLLLESLTESVEICQRTGARFQISHFKTSGMKNWGKLNRAFEIIEEAQAQGHHLRADRYPYLASFTQLSSALPNWVAEGGPDVFFKRLADPAEREKMRDSLIDEDHGDDYWERIVVSQAFLEAGERYEGRDVAALSGEAGQDPVDFVCDLCLAAKDRVAAVYHTMSRGNLERIYKKDWVMVGSDAAVRTHRGHLSEGKPHPRAYGCMPRMISWVVREMKWLDLPSAIKKMTFDPCDMLGIKDRGLVRAGLAADLVLFDPAAAADTATYELPQQYPKGIEMVMVNGKIAVQNGELASGRFGKVLRKAK